jgi:hypothetical protein
MTARKIVSQTHDFIEDFPSLGLPLGRVLTEAKTVVDELGRSQTYLPGQEDPEFVREFETIQLCVIKDRVYHSVHGNYTEDMLKPNADHDYIIEKNLDGNFTNTVYIQSESIKQKIEVDPSYADYLGLPAYDKLVNKTDLSIGVIDLEKFPPATGFVAGGGVTQEQLVLNIEQEQKAYQEMMATITPKDEENV